ncbi:DUF4351 domain-containing protein [Gloeobacter kilaueensis]|uniref:DUF4351 domain-containing protein n=1 Tax=Gloeobacter kilaueensis (strain ATCC BAA-2537 / CCAP 1431/1 / ULC 316 / JS1) TaxID=1183438 RepID=U5QF31_GLOK1|nr:DUF4351 domain-containing protein [Gloeobacter kilaueensis]AGY57531.1 hypothetical protein GKIL_1285 [Gloeobacter kilaueensis JS1]
MIDLLRETPLGREVLREWKQEAEQYAEQRAVELAEQKLEQSLQQGEIQGKRRTLVHQLTRKFGPLSADLLDSVQNISDPDRLERLIDAAVDSASLDRFRQQLG